MKLQLSRDPFRNLNRMSQLFNDEDLFSLDWDETELDMYEQDGKIMIELKAPGFDDKNVNVSIEDNVLTISGKAETREESDETNKKYYRKEISSRSFTRSVSLPNRVESDKAEATFKNGILHLSLPITEESKAKKIDIKVS